MRRLLRMESLENRALLSGGSLASYRLASAVQGDAPAATVQPLVAEQPAQIGSVVVHQAAADSLFSTGLAAELPRQPEPELSSLNAPLRVDLPLAEPSSVDSPDSPDSRIWWRHFFLASTDTRWDWVAQTQWYVPAENLLSYSMSSDLANPTAVADQTLWNIEASSAGIITGMAVTRLSSDPIPTQKTMTGYISPGGQIRIEFTKTGEPAISGVGQMRYRDHAWQMEMQMASSADQILSHWAYMVQATANTVPPEPLDPPPGSSLSEDWRWLKETRWAFVDRGLFGTESEVGLFEITSFKSGYFWGTGTAYGSQPLNVFGSVTPEGNLLLLFSVNGADAISRTGYILDGVGGATMSFRSYDGSSGIGSARLIGG
ncbi:MAG: hypothetical protein KF708_12475 [Pirellulales bacterium]|nr:hypothetical protein [Pirellulales bacterium]